MTTTRANTLWWIAIGIGAALALLGLESLNARTLNLMLLYAPGIDKVLHCAQSLLIFLFFYWLTGKIVPGRRARIGLAAVGTLLVAVGDEAVQQLTPQRHVELADILAGTAGLALGIGVILRRQVPRAAALTMTCALAVAGVVTFDSYSKTKDLNRGRLLEGQGRFAEARQYYMRALTAGASSASLYNGLAWVEVESGQGDPARAVAYAEKSLAMRPDDPDALDSYGWALTHAGRHKEALVALERALAAKPSIYCIHYHLGYVHLQLGNTSDALRHLRRQVTDVPGSREAQRAKDLIARMADPTTEGAH